MFAELTMRRTSPLTPDSARVDGVRILALLPRRWSRHLRQAGEQIVIRVDTDDESTSAQLRATVSATLTHPSLHHWHLTTCHPLG
ncbi:hypothetical protein [Sphaerisporangium fuscum]|uniref:hypothetical protein n=1 Tax=Sphaerisporangium fuscum TaxID=2835868 RepID=UPI001BDD72F7|nr:hypothetical protein [Sphaerisporangium fuscum]